MREREGETGREGHVYSMCRDISTTHTSAFVLPFPFLVEGGRRYVHAGLSRFID